MSKSTTASQEELLELIQAGPVEFVENHPEALLALRKETDHQDVKRAVDVVLNKYHDGRGV